MNREENNEEVKFQYILDCDGNMVEIPLDDTVEVEYPAKARIRNAFEVFVRVPYTEEYWVSNYGRVVNNRKHKNKNSFYFHREGNCWVAIFEIYHYPRKKRGVLTEEIEIFRRCYKIDELVAESFLVGKGSKIWHKDGNLENNWYKNLIYVTIEDYRRLQKGEIKWQDLPYKQEYVEYKNKATGVAYKVYHGIKSRCNNDDANSYYENTKMCDFWLENPFEFVKWYLYNFYEVGDESMAVDKDLFSDEDNKIYSPETCCIIPQSLNTMLCNCKKHKISDSELPIGVRFNAKTGKYYAEITFMGETDAIKLSEFNTPEEAFNEYKMMKEADIKCTVARYKNKIPEKVYKKMLTIEVKPN